MNSFGQLNEIMNKKLFEYINKTKYIYIRYSKIIYMYKKANLSIFLILAVALILFFVIYLSSQQNSSLNSEKLGINPELQSKFQTPIENCFDTISLEAISLAGAQGGMIYNGTFYEDPISSIHFALINNTITLPNINNISYQINQFIDNAFEPCIIEEFNSSGMLKSISVGTNSFRTSINYNEIIIEGNVSVSYYNQEKYIDAEDVRAVYKIPLNTILSDAYEILLQIKTNRTTEITINNVVISPVAPGVLVYSLFYNTTEIKMPLYLFQFAVDYIYGVDGNHKPIIDKIPEFSVNTGDSFQYQVNATDSDGDQLTYESITTLFQITNTGHISFVTSPSDKGSYEIPIIVEDSQGASSLDILRLTIN